MLKYFTENINIINAYYLYIIINKNILAYKALI